MFSKSVVAAALLASASSVTAWDPQNHGPLHGHPGPHPCKTTSTVVVTATTTKTTTVGAWGAGGPGGATQAAGASTANGWTGAPGGWGAAPTTVYETVTISVSPNGNGGWFTYKPSTSTVTGTSTVNAGGFGGHPWPYSASTASTSTSTVNGGGFGGHPWPSTGTASTAAAPTTTSTATGGHGFPTGTGTTTSTAPATPTAFCLTDDAATYLTNGYASLLTAYTNATADAILASDFTDTSDSINWLAGIPLGGYTFSSKAAFIAGQGTQPPIGFTVQSIMHSCTEVAFRWTATVGLQKWPAKGINTFVASNLNGTDAGWQIESMYSEFNVGAWEIDIGRTCAPQGANIAGSS